MIIMTKMIIITTKIIRRTTIVTLKSAIIIKILKIATTPQGGIIGRV